MPTLPNMGLVTPTLGGDSGTWDDKLNIALETLDKHDHSAGNGVRVPVSGLNIDKDLPCGGHGLTSLGRVVFTQIAAPANAICLFVNSADNELYWRTFSGTNVKLTSGTTINTSLVGGIAGDYSTVGAEVAYDDASDRYTFRQQGGTKPWARLASGDVRIYETGTTESVFVGLKTPAGLAASYDITWPLAMPGSTSVMLMDAAGVVTVTNTIPNAITFSAAATFSTGLTTTTLTGSGNATVGGTLGVTGLITATAGITAAADQSFEVSGTGHYKRGNRILPYLVRASDCIVTAGSLSVRAGNVPGAAWAASTVAYVPLPWHHSEREYTTVSAFRIYNNIAGTGNVTFESFICNTSGAFVSFGASQAIAIANPFIYTISLGALATGETLWLRVTTAGTNSGDIWSIAVTTAVL